MITIVQSERTLWIDSRKPEMKKDHSLTSSSLILKNTLLNLLGYGAPLVVAVFAIPLIVKSIGTDRFGVLTLTWVLTGYLSILDLGLGRALTKIVAERLGENRVAEIPCAIWTALSALALISIAISLMFWGCSHWLVYNLLKIPVGLKTETLYSLYLIALSIPVVIISVGFRGILEAYQRFDLVNAVRIPLGIFSFAAPLLVIPFSVKLHFIIAAIFMGRLFITLVQFFLCCNIIPRLLNDFSFDLNMFGKLLQFGGWMTVTNVISPLLIYLDRFFIGALLSITAVAYYATPSEVITKLTLVSGALMSVLFPVISASYNTDRQRAAVLVEQGLKYLFIVIFPIVLVIVSFAPEGLRIWLNEEFAQNCKQVTQILAIGIFFGCLGQIPYAFVQGAGRPDLTGKLHIVEMVLYLIALVGAIHWAGIVGAAIVWAIRFILDTVCLYLIAQNLMEPNKLKTKSKLAALAFAIFPLIVLACIEPIGYRIAGCLVTMTLFCWLSMRYFLTTEEKKFFRDFISLNNNRNECN
jgi:O-antigen/teichoic acid export membrane protein